ncbi:MAG: hypothetical protein V4460_16505 [Pseudomonadota bacterium]
MCEEAREQRIERVGIVHRDAGDFVPVLDQNGGVVVRVDDVVARIALARLGGDFGIEIVVGIFRLPIAERHAQRVEQGTVEVDTVLLRRGDGVFGHEQQIVCATPALEQILEGLAQHTFAPAAGDGAQPIEIGAIFVDECLADGPSPVGSRCDKRLWVRKKKG